MRTPALVLAALVSLTSTTLAQGKPDNQAPRQTQQGARVAGIAQTRQQQQLQHMSRHTEELAQQIRETNRWMEQNRARDEYRALGQQLGQSCDQLREMIRQTQQLRDRDQSLQQDRDRLRELDRLQDRFQDMDRSMTQAHDALRKMVGQR